MYLNFPTLSICSWTLIKSLAKWGGSRSCLEPLWKASPLPEIPFCEWPATYSTYLQFLQCSDKTREKCQPAQMQGPGRCKQKVGEITRRLWERRLLWNTLAFETKQKGSWTSWHLVGVVGVSELAMLEFRFWLCCSDELCDLDRSLNLPGLPFYHLWR